MSRPALPPARLVSSEPSDAAVRWVLRATFAMLLLLFVLVVIGNHVPPRP